MTRRPPRSPLFPYTPLFRPPVALPHLVAHSHPPASHEADGIDAGPARAEIPDEASRHAGPARHVKDARAGAERSEEHTSELQSRLHLVCRLLLEKKKKNAHILGCRRTKDSKSSSLCSLSRL